MTGGRIWLAPTRSFCIHGKWPPCSDKSLCLWLVDHQTTEPQTEPKDGVHKVLCYGLNMCDPIKGYVEIPMPHVKVLGGGAFGKVLGHEG